MSEPSKCLVFKGDLGKLFFVPDMSKLVKERQKILELVTEKVDAFDMVSIADPTLILTSKNSIYELQNMTQRLAFLNERVHSRPIVPANLTPNDLELMASEKNFLCSHILSLEQEIQNYRQSVCLISQSIGLAQQPTTKDPRVASLMVERNLRIKVICNAKLFYNSLFARKVELRQKVRQEALDAYSDDDRSRQDCFERNIDETRTAKQVYLERSVDEALSNYESLIRNNRYAVATIDKEIRQLDQQFHASLIAIDEDAHHLFCKRKMFAKKLAETEKLLSLANNRIAYIDERSKLFTGFENKDFQKISTCLRIGLGMDGEGVLASILQTDDARKKQKN